MFLFTFSLFFGDFYLQLQVGLMGVILSLMCKNVYTLLSERIMVDFSHVAKFTHKCKLAFKINIHL